MFKFTRGTSVGWVEHCKLLRIDVIPHGYRHKMLFAHTTQNTQNKEQAQLHWTCIAHKQQKVHVYTWNLSRLGRGLLPSTHRCDTMRLHAQNVVCTQHRTHKTNTMKIEHIKQINVK